MKSVTRAVLSRRDAIGGGLAGFLPAIALGQTTPRRPQPASVTSTPPRVWGPAAPPQMYPDPDVIIVDPSAADLFVAMTEIRRLWTGGMWTEGPAWSSEGQYLVFSDVQANVQYRYIWETGEVTPFRRPSYNSNGNAFDFQGCQLSTEDLFRRVVRWEHDGTQTVLADRFEGKPFNSPNDLVAHPDGSVWFTDPGYGTTLSEGHPDIAGGPSNPDGKLNPRVGTVDFGPLSHKKRELPGDVYRIDPGGRVTRVIAAKDVPDPNGLCFSPDYKTLYVVSTAKAPGDSGSGGRGVIYAFDARGDKLTNQRLFSDMVVDGVHGAPDGIRVDVNGNLWCGVNAQQLGYDGVWMLGTDGKLRARVRLPQLCNNVAFGGPKHNYLFMSCGNAIYGLMVQTQGAAPG